METTLAPIPSHEPTITTDSSGRSWELLNPNTDSELGARYRLTMTVKAPYTIANIQKLEDSLRIGTAVKNLVQWATLQQTIRIESFNAAYPKGGAAGVQTWDFTMIFRKTGGGSPLVLIIGAVAVIVTLTILASVVGSTIEKEATKVKDVATATVFNPWFLVAAVIVVLAVTGTSLTGLAKGR